MSEQSKNSRVRMKVLCLCFSPIRATYIYTYIYIFCCCCFFCCFLLFFCFKLALHQNVQSRLFFRKTLLFETFAWSMGSLSCRLEKDLVIWRKQRPFFYCWVSLRLYERWVKFEVTKFKKFNSHLNDTLWFE